MQRRESTGCLGKTSLIKNPRPFWRWLKNARGHGSGITDLHLSGRVISSGQEKAEAFREDFQSVFTQEDTNNVWKLKEELMSTRSEVKIEEVTLTEDEVCEQLRRIDPSKASGPDEIPGRFLREGAPWIASPLCRLFKGSISGCLPQDWTRANIFQVFKKGNKHHPRRSISGCLPRDWTRANISQVFKKGNKHHPRRSISGCLPQDWKRANISQVFKKGNNHHPRNYCPVSLTCLVVKVLEGLIHRQVVRFLIMTRSMHLSTAFVKHTPVRPSYLQQSTSELKTLMWYQHSCMLYF